MCAFKAQALRKTSNITSWQQCRLRYPFFRSTGTGENQWSRGIQPSWNSLVWFAGLLWLWPVPTEFSWGSWIMRGLGSGFLWWPLHTSASVEENNGSHPSCHYLYRSVSAWKFFLYCAEKGGGIFYFFCRVRRFLLKHPRKGSEDLKQQQQPWQWAFFLLHFFLPYTPGHTSTWTCISRLHFPAELFHWSL